VVVSKRLKGGLEPDGGETVAGGVAFTVANWGSVTVAENKFPPFILLEPRDFFIVFLRIDFAILYYI
jgi:hypothetical protein